jgi:hypothetical protein
MNEPNQSERKASASRLARGLSSMVSTAQQQTNVNEDDASQGQPHPALLRDVVASGTVAESVTQARVSQVAMVEPAVAMVQRNAEIAQQIARDARLETVVLRRKHYKLVMGLVMVIAALLAGVGYLAWWVSDLQQQADAWRTFSSNVPAGADTADAEVDVVAQRVQDERELRRLRSELKDARSALEAANRVMDESAEAGRGQSSPPRR